ncbi:MAG: PLP-dependent aminotransferase family protein [Steroidobacteraceae bacterium]
MNRPVEGWEIILSLDEAGADPLARRIARAIAAEVRRGRLQPGARLPGSRTLARTLNVHRNTVIAAYEQLAGEGWTEPQRARGTFIARSVPRPPKRARRNDPGPFGTAVSAGFEVRGPDGGGAGMAHGRLRPLSEGAPDVRLAPVVELTRAYRRVLRHGAADLLAYGHPQGHPRLRAALAELLRSRRAIAADAEHLVVTSGSQMALELVARALLQPGDTVAVEAFGYRPAWRVFRQQGAALAAVPLDAGGLNIAALEALAERTALRAVYVTPHHQYPTTVTLSAPRRMALLELARRKRFAIIEDDYDHEFHYEGQPVQPMASADRAGVVLYVGTLAKVLAPGVRLGYLLAPPPLPPILTALRIGIDRQGDHAVECAVADLLERGELQRHVQRARRTYRARRDHCVSLLKRELNGSLSFSAPSGGMTLWAEAAVGIDVDAWAQRLQGQGWQVLTGRHYAYDAAARPNLRLAFASYEEEEFAEAIGQLRAAL